jgi:hypothetical protein
MGWVLLACSVLLTAASCRAAVTLFGARGWDRFWMWAIVAPSQLGLAACVTSLFNAFDGIPFLAAQALIAGAMWGLSARFRRRDILVEPERMNGGKRRVDAAIVFMALLACTLLTVSLCECLMTQLVGVDERMYHASRVAYWLQHRNVFYFQTNNDRQVAFPFGAELVFAWPLLFVKNEVIGRGFHWLAVPGSAAGIAAVCRILGLNGRVAMARALAYLATPALLALGSSLRSDLWQPLYLLGSVYWVIRPGPLNGRAWAPFAMAGGFLALAMNVKMTAMGLGPGLLLAALCTQQAGSSLARIRSLAIGGAVVTLACGLGITVTSNMRHFHRPMGPAWIGKAVQPEFSPRQLYVHAARTVTFLLELPEVPSETIRQGAEKIGAKFAHAIRADALLSREEDPVWPGSYSFKLRPSAANFSLPGAFWLPMLALGLLSATRDVAKSWRRPRIGPVGLLALMQTPLFLGVILLIRWMGAGPARFWLGVYALMIPVGAWFIGRWASRSGIVGGVAVFLIFWTGYSAFREVLMRLDYALHHPHTPAQLDGPLMEIPPLLPPRSNIMFVSGSSTRDYALFDPGHGFVNKVFAWGQLPFDAPKIAAFVEEHKISHVVIEHDETVQFYWVGPLVTKPLVEWLDARPDFKLVPLKTPHVRLYERVPSPSK